MLTLTVSATFFGVPSLRFAHLSRLADRDLVRYVPDDAFYYPCWARTSAYFMTGLLTGRHPRQGSICCGDILSQSSMACSGNLLPSHFRCPVFRQRNPAESWPCLCWYVIEWAPWRHLARSNVRKLPDPPLLIRLREIFFRTLARKQTKAAGTLSDEGFAGALQPVSSGCGSCCACRGRCGGTPGSAGG